MFDLLGQHFICAECAETTEEPARLDVVKLLPQSLERHMEDASGSFNKGLIVEFCVMRKRASETENGLPII
eukprot:3269846-Amphidinium_carterae.1